MSSEKRLTMATFKCMVKTRDTCFCVTRTGDNLKETVFDVLINSGSMINECYTEISKNNEVIARNDEAIKLMLIFKRKELSDLIKHQLVTKYNVIDKCECKVCQTIRDQDPIAATNHLMELDEHMGMQFQLSRFQKVVKMYEEFHANAGKELQES